jgi:hypothetical protein
MTYTAIKELIYNDYTNLNIDLIDKYDLSLDMFANEFELPRSIIREIPMHQLDILIEKMGIIIANSKEEKTFMFDITDIEEFIAESVKYIIKDIQMLGVLDNK